MIGRLCTAAAASALAVLLSTSPGCDSESSSTGPTGPVVDASGKPTPEAISKATPPAGKKGGGAPIMPGR